MVSSFKNTCGLDYIWLKIKIRTQTNYLVKNRDCEKFLIEIKYVYKLI
jgi:hypothetical protein